MSSRPTDGPSPISTELSLRFRRLPPPRWHARALIPPFVDGRGAAPQPGTGKTLLAKAVANQTSATFLRVVDSELIQKYLGDGPKLVRELFRVADDLSPTIAFIDEVGRIALPVVVALRFSRGARAARARVRGEEQKRNEERKERR